MQVSSTKILIKKWKIELTYIVVLMSRANALSSSPNISQQGLGPVCSKCTLVAWEVSTGSSIWSSACHSALHQMRGQPQRMFWRRSKNSSSFFEFYCIIGTIYIVCVTNRSMQQQITKFYSSAEPNEPWSVEGMLQWLEDLIIEHDLVSKSDLTCLFVRVECNLNLGLFYHWLSIVSKHNVVPGPGRPWRLPLLQR